MNLGPYLLGPNSGSENGIYAGDARELAKAIPDESVDIVFTSPPYNKGLDYGVWDDKMPDADFWQFQEDWLTDAFRVAKDGARLYVTVCDDMLWPLHEIGIRIGWRFHQLLAWCKPNLGNPGRISGDWNRTAEWCLLFHKGTRITMLGDVWGVNTFNWIVEASAQSNYNGLRRKVFAAQMAYRVAYTWLARTPGDIIWEPFAGSGTTCMAAKALGRHYLAAEIDPGTAALARDRVRHMVAAPLFVAQPEQLAMIPT